MTNPQNNLPRRMTKVEGEVRDLRSLVAKARKEAGEARVLAAGADEEVAGLRTQASVLNALRVTQLEHGEDIRELKSDVGTLKSDMRRLESGLTRVHAGVNLIITKLDERE